MPGSSTQGTDADILVAGSNVDARGWTAREDRWVPGRGGRSPDLTVAKELVHHVRHQPPLSGPKRSSARRNGGDRDRSKERVDSAPREFYGGVDRVAADRVRAAILHAGGRLAFGDGRSRARQSMAARRDGRSGDRRVGTTRFAVGTRLADCGKSSVRRNPGSSAQTERFRHPRHRDPAWRRSGQPADRRGAHCD